jgi:nucleotide-binding universal stress UspA family protein
VGIDDSPGGVAALRWAVECARARGARLIGVRAWALAAPRHGRRRHHGHVVFTFAGTELRQAATRLITRAFREAAGGVPGDIEVTISTPEGDPGPVLTKIASGGDNVLVVGTTRGTSLKRIVHGSVSAYCVRHSRCPVAVVPARLPRRFARRSRAAVHRPPAHPTQPSRTSLS